MCKQDLFFNSQLCFDSREAFPVLPAELAGISDLLNAPMRTSPTIVMLYTPRSKPGEDFITCFLHR